MPAFDWLPVILTVHEDYYEEKLDHNLERLLPANLRIEKVSAFKTTRPRFVGDIGLRAFFQLYRKAKQMIIDEGFDFLYIPIPSFYAALLGRWLHASTGIRYGIDYIDPWVHQFPGTDKRFSRHWFSTKLAKFLEPIAVRKTSLITGVAEGYYSGVISRNPHLSKSAKFGAMPYGGEATDHEQVHSSDIKPYLFQKSDGKTQLVYAGAMLPKAYGPLEAIFKAIKQQREVYSNVEFHFIGTGKSPNDSTGYNIRPLAEKYGLWKSVIFEYPARIPYFDVLVHLNGADGAFILGSTEPHYTPSKVYQAVLSGKPVFAVLHRESSAVKVITESGAGTVLAFNGAEDIDRIQNDFTEMIKIYLAGIASFDPLRIDREIFNQYSAENITAELVKLLNEAVV